MVLPDVNVLIYAHREDLPQHAAAREWLDTTVSADEPFGLSELVLSGFLRVVTNPRALVDPTPMDVALATVERWRSPRNCVLVLPGPAPLAHLRRVLPGSGREGQSRTGRLSRGAGDRVRERVDHDGSRLRPLSGAALARSAGGRSHLKPSDCIHWPQFPPHGAISPAIVALARA